MTPLDTNKMALVGAPPSQRHKISQCIEKRCEGCNCKVYFSRSGFLDGKRQARRQHDEFAIVCGKCVNPWIQGVARNGGHIVAADSVMDSDVLPAIERAREDQLRSN